MTNYNLYHTLHLHLLSVVLWFLHPSRQLPLEMAFAPRWDCVFSYVSLGLAIFYAGILVSATRYLREVCRNSSRQTHAKKLFLSLSTSLCIGRPCFQSALRFPRWSKSWMCPHRPQNVARLQLNMHSMPSIYMTRSAGRLLCRLA